jgi:hypothetical protein
MTRQRASQHEERHMRCGREVRRWEGRRRKERRKRCRGEREKTSLCSSVYVSSFFLLSFFFHSFLFLPSLEEKKDLFVSFSLLLFTFYPFLHFCFPSASFSFSMLFLSSVNCSLYPFSLFLSSLSLSLSLYLPLLAVGGGVVVGGAVTVDTDPLCFSDTPPLLELINAAEGKRVSAGESVLFLSLCFFESPLKMLFRTPGVVPPAATAEVAAGAD